MVLQRFYGKPVQTVFRYWVNCVAYLLHNEGKDSPLLLLPKLSHKVSCWLGPWDYSVEGTQKRSLGGFSEEGLGASGFS